MGLSLPEILELSCMKNAEVLVKGDNYHQKVTSITIMETPSMEHCVKKDQLVLTSLYVLSNEYDSIDSFVKGLKNAEIGGIIVKMRCTKINYQYLITACEKYRMNLIKIEKTDVYSDIIQGVMEGLFAFQLTRANYFKSCHDSFMKIAQSGEGVEKIIKTLTGMVNSVIVAYNLNGKILASNLYNDFRHNTVFMEDNSPVVVGENIEYFQSKIKIKDSIMEGIIIPLKAISNITAYLFVKITEGMNFNEYEWSAIENAVNVLNLEMTKQFAVNEIEQRFKNDLLSDLIVGNIPSESIVLRRADTLGWDLSKTYIAVVVKLNMEHNSRSRSDLINVMRGIQDIFNRTVHSVFENNEQKPIVGMINDTFTILWCYDNDKSYNKNADLIRDFIEKLLQKTQKQFDVVSYSGGIGHEVNNIYDISKSYEDATKALKYGQIVYGDNKICDYNGLGVYRLITKIGNRDELMEFIPTSLKKLVDYDNASKNVLVHTLDTYLNCDCNLSKAATELQIHYKTLVYRINRIKEIMDVENLEGDIRLELQLALKIMKIMSGGSEQVRNL